ncbi:MAG: polysaccharide deacetylase family protein [Solirubrobacteraceae bacterium]
MHTEQSIIGAVETGADTLALTFDDGPDARWTPRLLDVLARAGARATFFPIAPRAAAHPDLVARMVSEGHAVGLHCDAHERHSRRCATWVRADTRRALARLRDLWVSPTLWRTPWGDVARWTDAVAAEHGLRLVGWSVDTHDWRGDDAATMLAATAHGLRPGAIVLAHDGIGPGARRPDPRQTIAFVKLVTRYAAERRLILGTLG